MGLLTDIGSGSEGQELDSVRKLVRVHGFCNQVEIAYAVADGDIKLVSVEDTRKGNSCRLPPLSFGQKILILREEGTPQFGGPVQQ